MTLRERRFKIIQNNETKAYFTGNGWSPREEEAKQYSLAIEAAKTCLQCDLGDVILVSKIETCA